MFSISGFEKTFEYLDLFKQGLICTVSLSFFTVLFGFMLALVLAVMRLSDFRPFRSLALTADGHEKEEGFAAALSRFNPISFIATVYVEVFRATPMLVQLFIIYYVVFANVSFPTYKIFGFIRTDRFIPGVVALAMNSGAYLSEIIRAGIQSIDGGQTEASRSLGLSQFETMRYIILPQAIKNILPALLNEVISLLKETSISGYIGLMDLTKGGDIIRSNTYEAFLPLIAVAIIYLALVMLLSFLAGKLERRLRNNER